MRIRPSGSVFGTVGDLASFTAVMIRRGVLTDGSRLVSEASVERLERMEYSVAGRAAATVGHAKGQFHYLRAGQVWHGHWGKVDGFRAAYGYLPRSGRGLVLIVNTLDGRAREKLLTRLAEAAADGLPPNRAVAAPAALEPLRSFGGWYVDAAPDREMIGMPISLAGALRVRIDAASAEPGVRVTGGFGGSANDRYLAVGGPLLQLPDATGASAVLVRNDEGASFIAGTRFAHRAAWLHIGLLSLTALCVAIAGIAVLYAPFWLVRAARGGYSQGDIALRAAPLVSAASAAAVSYMVIAGLFFADDSRSFERAGFVTPWSVTVFVASWLFPLAALAGLYASLRVRRGPGRRFAHRFALVASIALLLWACYWWAYGWIGLRTWAD